MKLLTIDQNSNYSLGVKTSNGVIDVEKALKQFDSDKVSSNVMEIINVGEEALKELKDYIEVLPSDGDYILEEDEINYGPAVTIPEKIICVGLNYRTHADETNAPYPDSPILFTKYNNALTGHKKDIVIPVATEKLDYEVELGIVIGKTSKNVSKKDAISHVFGYFAANDLSARDLQFLNPQWLLGKTCDDFSPIGPYLVTKDEIPNPNNLNLRTIVNGEVRQNSNTSDMIFSCEEIISYISQFITLKPGDIILTGTPEGVILGMSEEEQVYLKHGDEVTVEIDHLGQLTNKFVRY